MTNRRQITNKPLAYEICVQGHINEKRSEWFEHLEVVPREDGTSLLRGILPDQSALHSILIKIRDMNLTLIAVQQIEI